MVEAIGAFVRPQSHWVLRGANGSFHGSKMGLFRECMSMRTTEKFVFFEMESFQDIVDTSTAIPLAK